MRSLKHMPKNRDQVRLFAILSLATMLSGCTSSGLQDMVYRPCCLEQPHREVTQFRGQSPAAGDSWTRPVFSIPRTAAEPAAFAGHAGLTSQPPQPIAGGWSLSDTLDKSSRQRPVVLSATIETTTEDEAVRLWTQPDLDTKPLAVRSREQSGPGLLRPDREPEGSPQPGTPRARLRAPRPVPETVISSSSAETTVNSSSALPLIAPNANPGSRPASPAFSSGYVGARTWQDLASPSVREPQSNQPADLPNTVTEPPVALQLPAAEFADATNAAASPLNRQPDLQTNNFNDTPAQIVSRPVITREIAEPAPQSPMASPGSNPDNALPDVEAATADAADPAATAQDVREQSMLDRFRDLYSPGDPEDAAADGLRRQFRRLQSPWNLFGEKASTAEAVLAPAAPPEQAVVDATAAGVDESTQVTALVTALITEVERELQNWPRDGAGRPLRYSEWRLRQTDLRLLYLVAANPSDAVAMIPDLPSEEQEFWQSLLMAASYYRNGDQAMLEPQSRSEALTQLRVAVRRLQALAPLQIRRLTFCSAIHGFGSLDAFPSSTFRPGEPVLLYAELQNFRSRHTPAGTYRTELSATLEILREGMLDPLEVIRLPVMADESISERTDFYQSYELTIPAHLRPGRYSVRLIVRDQSADQSAEAAAEFDVR